MSRALSPLLWSRIALCAGVLGCAGTPSLAFAQGAGFDLAVHTNPHVTAASVGLPAYPGATLRKHDNSDGAFDLEFTMGDSSFRMMGISYESGDSPTQVLAFYREPLSHYGEVLECDHGQPVGALTVTSSGVTCSNPAGDRHGHLDAHAYSSSDHELRAGTPHRLRIVATEDARSDRTSFVLLYLKVPEGAGAADK
jgi:hypothetical protein